LDCAVPFSSAFWPRAADLSGPWLRRRASGARPQRTRFELRLPNRKNVARRGRRFDRGWTRAARVTWGIAFHAAAAPAALRRVFAPFAGGSAGSVRIPQCDRLVQLWHIRSGAGWAGFPRAAQHARDVRVHLYPSGWMAGSARPGLLSLAASA